MGAAPPAAAQCAPRQLICIPSPTTTTTAVPVTVAPPAAPTPAPAPAPVPAPTPVPGTPRSVPDAAQRLLDLVNMDRSRAGVGPLTMRGDVVSIALAHSNRMAAAGTIWHNDEYFTAATRSALGAELLGENVAHNMSVDDTHARLMNSPGHRANILDGRFTAAGFAVVQTPEGRYYTTQNFMRPAGAPAPRASAAPVGAAAPARSRAATPAPTTTAPAPPPAPAPAPAPAESPAPPAPSGAEAAAPSPSGDAKLVVSSPSLQAAPSGSPGWAPTRRPVVAGGLAAAVLMALPLLMVRRRRLVEMLTG